MTLVRRVARPLLAAIFVVQGLDQLRHPSALKPKVAPFAEQLAPLGLPNDPELLVRANGATMVGGGALLATGRVPRLASLALAGALVPTTYVGHPFWAETDPADQAHPADRLPQEPRPARWPPARQRRHRGQAGAGLPRRACR